MQFVLLALFASSWFMPRLFCEEFDSLDHAIVSLYALDCETGEVLFEKNSALSLVPASCMKIVTTTAALHLLGAESRFETYLEYDGVLDETLEGNLYIRGGGDPCLGSDRIPRAPFHGKNRLRSGQTPSKS